MTGERKELHAMRRFRMSTIATLMCLIALLASSCGGDGPPSADAPAEATTEASPAAGAEGGVTITFGALSFMRHAYEPLIDAFNAQHPGIKVQFVLHDEVYQDSGDNPEQTRQIVSRADTADAGASEAEFQQGLLRDLKPLIDADANFTLDEYPAALLTPYRQGDQLHGLPWGLNFTGAHRAICSLCTYERAAPGLHSAGRPQLRPVVVIRDLRSSISNP
jgi:ABC-type glycerol-3-phosphate transport system substrate-binding protein